MDHSNFNNLLYSLYITAALSGCRCKETEPVPQVNNKIELNCYDYWPTESNKKWVYKVSKIINSNLVYMYDDTMFFIKDTNLVKTGILVFKEYGFNKLPQEYNFILGNYPSNKDALFVLLSGQNYVLFDLNNVQDSGAYKKYSMDGSPFDTRYKVQYITPLYHNYNTLLGGKTILYSFIQFREPYPNSGYINTNRQLFLSKNLGLMEYVFEYELKNIQSIPDSALYLKYEIKEIIN